MVLVWEAEEVKKLYRWYKKLYIKSYINGQVILLYHQTGETSRSPGGGNKDKTT